MLQQAPAHLPAQLAVGPRRQQLHGPAGTAAMARTALVQEGDLHLQDECPPHCSPSTRWSASQSLCGRRQLLSWRSMQHRWAELWALLSLEVSMAVLMRQAAATELAEHAAQGGKRLLLQSQARADEAVLQWLRM